LSQMLKKNIFAYNNFFFWGGGAVGGGGQGPIFLYHLFHLPLCASLNKN
jgi:hypothetical protein